MARICVFCASSERIDPAYVDLASRVGTAIAAAGHDLVTGGGRISMMGAVAKAVRDGGGHTLGVIPQALVELEVADHDSDELVVTQDMRERKGRMDAAADAFLTLPGGLGTLEELTEVWVAASLGMHAKPVVVLDPDGLFAPLHALTEHLERAGFVRREAIEALVWTTDVEAAMAAVEAGLTVPSEGPAAGGTVEDTLESAP